MEAASQRSTGEVARWSVALLTAAAAAIHFAVIRDHFDAYWAYGLFFALSGWAQMLWALAIVRASDRRLLVAGIAGNLAIAIAWGVSRTSGLPIGPDAGAAEPVQFIDALATALELLAALAALATISRTFRGISRRSASAFIITLSLVIVAATTMAIVHAAGHANETRHRGEIHEQAPHP